MMNSEIDWYQRGIEDAEIQDGLDAEPDNEPRFYTPTTTVFVISPPDNGGYNAFDTMSKEDIERFRINEEH